MGEDTLCNVSLLDFGHLSAQPCIQTQNTVLEDTREIRCDLRSWRGSASASYDILASFSCA
jgi:hypothetical protein